MDTSTVLKKTGEAVSGLAGIGYEAAKLKVAAEHAVEDGKLAAQRLAKQGYRKMEDVVDETQYRIKRNPLESVGIAFGIGAILGCMIGYTLSRR
jgi:ElaB/YqjD/DUF883 family membrane-anchored ribosome-binding protein